MRRSRRSSGGGYSVSPSNFVSVGNPIYQQYSGPGKDCVADAAVRPSFLSMFPGSLGVSGMAGGKRRKHKRRSMRGGTRLAVASFENPVGDMLGAPPAQVSAPGVATHAVDATSPATDPSAAAEQGAHTTQTGGRYESNLGAALDSVSAIGMSSYAPIRSIACEGAHANSMNTGMGMIQRPMLGGAMLANPLDLRATTAGYSHQFETLGGTSAVGGLMLNVPADGRASNPACSTTGGKRSTRSKRTRRGKKSKRSKRSLKKSRKHRK
uniref:Uncharacterized protein n=1 Tax=viral metagenome TaxID=1070528 RepID=A0A6C0DCY5_9ZZZZ